MKINRKLIAKQMCILMAVAFFSSSFSSCKDKENNLPVITAVRKTNNPDSTFTGSFPDQLIVIIGENLKETRHVWFNNAEAEFNPNYRTNTSVIVTIPANIPLKGTDPTAPNEIRLETPYGTARYSFSFYSQVPIADSLKLDFDIPARAGKTLTIEGLNFYEVQKIVFRNVEGNIEVTDFVVENYKKIHLIFPKGSDKDGFIDVVYLSNTVSKEFMPDPIPNPITVSSDMPIVGDTVIITGEYFFNIEKIVLQNGVKIEKSNFEVYDKGRKIKFKMPAQTPTQGGALKVVALREGELVEYAVPGYFYPYEQVLADFDNQGWFSWGNPYEAYSISKDKPPYISTGKVGRIAGTPPSAPNWWWEEIVENEKKQMGQMVVGFQNWPSTIPDNTLLEKVVLKFSFYTELPFEKGYFRMALAQRFADKNFPEPFFRPYYDDKQIQVGSKPGRWIDYEIPLTEFAKNGDLKTYRDIKALPTKEVGFFYVNPTEDATVMNVFFDNFRFVVK